MIINNALKKTKRDCAYMVKQFKKQFNIKGIPDADKLIDIAGRLGYATQRILPEENEPDGYVFDSGDIKTIYYNQHLNSLDLIIVLTHELAHVFLNHLYRSDSVYDTSVYKDYEANVFTSILLKGVLKK